MSNWVLIPSCPSIFVTHVAGDASKFQPSLLDTKSLRPLPKKARSPNTVRAAKCWAQASTRRTVRAIGRVRLAPSHHLCFLVRLPPIYFPVMSWMHEPAIWRTAPVTISQPPVSAATVPSRDPSRRTWRNAMFVATQKVRATFTYAPSHTPLIQTQSSVRLPGLD